ncbi:MAG: GH23 / GH103 [uncultured Solirubrobacterales bacterium]|uniref:GH23 / GH103 n=1 Tax=uncultured Solirubrobacterales bacterium TaxID=768556 RepID=A0A6J4S861_9ACTN|nr:MAG: GH23 / GH103 [uncultured Solirubrobacterales bacterium]
MRKRSIYGVLVGALLAGLVLVVGSVATAGSPCGTADIPCEPAPAGAGAAEAAPEVNVPETTTPPTGGGGGDTGGDGTGGAPQKPGKPPVKEPGKGGGKTPPAKEPGKGRGETPAKEPDKGGATKPKPKPRAKPKPKPRPAAKGRARTRPRSTGAAPKRSSAPPMRAPGGAPTPSNPGFFDGSPGGDPLTGVPNFTIRHFKIPLFLMPIYQAAGTEYGIRWEYLAGINEIETNYGRNLNVSTAGALGWMQFMPATWKAYGVDANKDGRKDPYNPADAIFAAARYLKASGGPQDMRKAIFAYNHAGWYVDSVVLRTRLIAGMSPDLVGSLTGLAEARFPVRGDAKYADDVSERQLRRKVKPGQNAAEVISDDPNRKNIRIFAKKGSPVIAVNDGVVKDIGESDKLGKYMVVEDNFGNRFTYGNLGSISAKYPVPKEDVRKQAEQAATQAASSLNSRDPKPKIPASAGRQVGAGTGGLAAAVEDNRGGAPAPAPSQGGSRFSEPVVKERLFAHPNRPNAMAAGGADQMAATGGDPLAATPNNLGGYFLNTRGFNPKDFQLMPLRKGAQVMGDTILGRLGEGDDKLDPNLSFEVRPAGKDAPAIDPKPLLDGWKLLEATAIYRASGKNVLRGGTSVGQILLMPKQLLQKRVLADDRIDIYSCGRKDIASGQVSRQVLATLAYLSEVGLEPTVTSLKCGHSFYTTSGNVSAHSSGDALDISRWNGQPVLGNQQRGGPTYQAIKRLMLLQGNMKPQQLISLFEIGGPTIRMGDHADHLHVGFERAGGNGRPGGVRAATLKGDDWFKLVDRLGDIDNPAVPRKPSKYSLPSGGGERSSGAHRGE